MPRGIIKGRTGLVFTVAVVVVVLIALPAARRFLAASVALGLVVALILRLTRPRIEAGSDGQCLSDPGLLRSPG